MKAFTVYVPEEKEQFFIELLKYLHLKAREEKAHEIDIPEAHQKLVMERFDKGQKNPERLLDWEEVKKTL